MLTAAETPIATLARTAIAVARAERGTGPAKAPSTFAQMANELFLTAQREAIGCEQLEYFLAAHPSPMAATTLAETRRAAAIIAEVHALLLALVPLEGMVRALIAGEQQ